MAPSQKGHPGDGWYRLVFVIIRCATAVVIEWLKVSSGRL